MKRFKNLALALVSATFLTVGLYSCSNDEINNPQQESTEQSNLQSKNATTSDEGYSYALSFYSGDISLGRSVDLTDPDTSEGVTVTEVTVYGDSRARGYIVNKLENNDFLYFADVDRSANILTTFEKATSETRLYNNLTESPDYLTTNKFDFIEYSPGAINTTYGKGDCSFWKKLFGKCTTYMDPSYIGNGDCTQQVNVVRYLLFQPIDNSGSYLYEGPCSGTK